MPGCIGMIDAGFLEFNRQHYQSRARENHRVDWPKRDRVTCRQLLKILSEQTWRLDSPRLSMRWYLSRLPTGAMVEKKLSKMPLTRLFFKRYCEDITDQVRRLAFASGLLVQKEGTLRRWRLLRVAGLSDERLTSMSERLLSDVLEDLTRISALTRCLMIQQFPQSARCSGGLIIPQWGVNLDLRGSWVTTGVKYPRLGSKTGAN